MDTLIQILIGGLSNASVYALIAFGFSLTFITTETLNFAQGEFLMAGGLLAAYMVSTNAATSNINGYLGSTTPPGFPLWLAFIIAVLIMSAFGVLLERFVMRPFSKGLSIAWIMSTVAISIILRNIFESFVTNDKSPIPNVVQTIAGSKDDVKINIGTQSTSAQNFLNMAITLAIIVGLQLFFTRTMLGKSVRAVAFNPSAASLMGINVNFVKAFAFALSAGLAAIAGVVLAPTFGGVGPNTGQEIVIIAFAVAIIGGIDNLIGIAIAAVLFGVLKLLIQNYVTEDLFLVVIFVLLIVALAVKPTGLFGRTIVQKV